MVSTDPVWRKTGWRVGAKNVRCAAPTSVTNGIGKVREDCTRKKTVTGSSMGSERSYAPSAKYGKGRRSIIKTRLARMACRPNARSVRTTLLLDRASKSCGSNLLRGDQRGAGFGVL